MAAVVISIHALLAESDPSFLSAPFKPTLISIHALLAESDVLLAPARYTGALFLSTLSLRRATFDYSFIFPIFVISIHALLAESDVRKRPLPWPDTHFYPRSPCGERPIFAVRPYDAPIFLSTLSLRRATSVTTSFQGGFAISIHALLAESDGVLGRRLWDRQQFLSTLSLRRATGNFITNELLTALFLSTLSLRRAT